VRRPGIRLPVSLARTGASILVPGGRDRAARSGLRQQRDFMKALMGRMAAAAIGDSAQCVHHST
jgi:hypothetical protein